MTGSRYHRLCGASLPEVLTSQRFGTSARKGENGFVRKENCFVEAVSTKHSRQKCEDSQRGTKRQISEAEKFRFLDEYFWPAQACLDTAKG
jgi:hypothetical protein